MATNNIYSMGQVDVGGTPAKAATPTPTVKTPAATIPAPAVFTGAKATDFLNTQIIPTVTNNQQIMADAATKKAEDEKAAADKKAADEAAKKAAATATPVVTPAPVGAKNTYDANGAQGPQIPTGTTVADYNKQYGTNYSETPPVGKPVEGSFTVGTDGNTIKKYNDGTYAIYNSEGQRLRTAQASEYNNAAEFQKTTDQYIQAKNGAYPLDPNQQAQIDSVIESYKRLTETQDKLNKNFEGGTTIAQNLYGIGNSDFGRGEIKGVMEEGVKKINDIQSKMRSDVSAMTLAFQDKNLARLKDAYDSFSKNQGDLQKSLDKTHDEIAAKAAQADQNLATIHSKIDDDIRSLMAAAAKGNATTEQLNDMKAALDAHDYAGAVKAAGDTTIEFSAAGKEYNDYKRIATQNGQPVIGWDEYQNRDANRKARVAAAGASIAAGTNMNTKQQAVFNTLIQRQNTSPLLMALDRAVILKDAIANAKANPSDGYTQQNLAYSYVQALDTYNSAVREGELSAVSNLDSLQGKFTNNIEKINNGQYARPEVILNMANSAQLLYNSIKNAAELKKNNFKATAISNGIGEQYDEWDNTVSNLNKKTIGEQALDEHSKVQSMSDDDLINGMSNTTSTSAKTDNKSFFDGL